MTEDEEFEALEQRLKLYKRDIAAEIAEGMKEVPRIRDCKHNWVEGSNTDRPAYRCTRCGAWRFVE